MLLTINFVTGVGSAAFGLVCRFLVFLEGDVTMVKVMIIFDNENTFGISVYHLRWSYLYFSPEKKAV